MSDISDAKGIGTLVSMAGGTCFISRTMSPSFLPAWSNALEKRSVCLAKPIGYLQALSVTATTVGADLFGHRFDFA